MDTNNYISADQIECNDKHQLLLESGLVSYIALTVNGTIDDCNESFCAQLGYTISTLLNKSIDVVISEESKKNLVNILYKNNVADKTISFSCPFIKKTGQVLHGMLNGKSFLCKRCNDIKFYFVFTDVTEKVNALEKITSHVNNLKLKDDLIQAKDVELKRQNQELLRLNKELNEQALNSSTLETRIIMHEMRSKEALSAVNDGIWEWDYESGLYHFSDKFFTMLGYDPFEFPQTIESFLNLVHEEERDVIKTSIEKLQIDTSFEMAIECRMYKKDGNFLWVLSRGKVVDENNEGIPVRIFGTHVDIDQRKRFELVLRQNEESLQKQNEEYQKINKRLEKSNEKTLKLFRNIEDKQAYLNSILKSVPATILLESNRIILFANDYTALMTGYDLDELYGMDVLILYQTENEYHRVGNILFQNTISGSSKSVNTVWKMKNGTLIDVYITAANIETDFAQNTFTVSAIDITSQRIYEEELIAAKEQAEKAEKLKSVFLCNMSHELRTPANGIIGFAEMLQMQVNPSKRDQYLKIIINSSKQLVKIISDIVDISKIETGEIEVFHVRVNLKNLMIEYCNTFQNYISSRGKSHISLDFELNVDESIKYIQTDEHKLRQILFNLLNNAVKFTESGSIKYGCTIKDGTIEFYVSDTGIGIDSSEYDSIFECFRQTETPMRKLYGGNGLGLAIAKGFVKVLEGKIWVESVKDEGSTFYFALPYIPIDEEVIYSDNPNNINWKNYHILVVEDDITSMSLIDALLDETAIKVSHASTGLEAVKVCKKDKSIDLVLMDMRLPELDGYEATRRIKEIRPNLFIIAQTAHALTEDREKCINAGCDEYITKPLDQENLFNLIGGILTREN